jgi:hypothetical protein
MTDDEHMKRYSPSLIIWEMSIKTIMRRGWGQGTGGEMTQTMYAHVNK